MTTTEVDTSVARSKLADLHRLLSEMPSAVVAFSGGADSTLLAFMAHQVLGVRALAVTADSPSLPRSELLAAAAFANRFGLSHEIVVTDEMEDERYRRNTGDRCYFCKDALMVALEAISHLTGASQILVGVNTDDLTDHRPGQQAVLKRGGRWPMAEVGISKAEVRWISRDLGLPTWDKPAAACLASRIAYGVPVTREALARIESAEEGLRQLGLSGQLRVRDQGRELARIEADPSDFELILQRHATVVQVLKDAGFLFVTLDLEGYRQGSHNQLLSHIAINRTKAAPHREWVV